MKANPQVAHPPAPPVDPADAEDPERWDGLS